MRHYRVSSTLQVKGTVDSKKHFQFGKTGPGKADAASKVETSPPESLSMIAKLKNMWQQYGVVS
jgi:hypothetical protein